MRTGLALLGIFIAISAFGWPARAEQPSFDCAKAKTAAEKWICEDEGPPVGSDVPWYDREIAKLYREARRRVAPSNIIELGQSQRAFLDARERCVGKSIDCMMGLHERRVRALVALMPGVARYEKFVRPTVKSDGYGDVGEGAMRMITIGDRADIALDAHSWWGSGGNYCGFEAADLTRKSSLSDIVWTGEMRWPHESPDVAKRSCKVVFKPKGDDIEVESDGCYETEFSCGHNAWILGTYKRLRERH
jgi:uncharacterized protein